MPFPARSKLPDLRPIIREAGIRAFETVLGMPGTKKGGEHYFRCPFHDDTHASLRVSVEKMAYLCDVCKKDGDIFHLYAKLNGLRDREDFPKITSGLIEALGLGTPEVARPNPGPRSAFQSWEERKDITAVYEYRDETGALLFQKARVVDAAGKKSFQQRKPKPEGGWNYTTVGVRRVPYKLELLAKAPGAVVVVVEGEKDVDTLTAAGILATSSPDGAGTWKPEWNHWFKDREVLIIPDNDEPGEKHAALLAAELAPVAFEVRVWRPATLVENAPKGFDVSDYLAGKTVTMGDVLNWWQAGEKIDPQAAMKRSLEDMDILVEDTDAILDSTDTETKFVLGRVLPSHGISVLASGPGIGKSTLSRNLALAVARGEKFLGMDTMRGTVLLFPMEENDAEVRRHLRGLGLSRNDRVVVAHVGDKSRAFDGLAKLVAAYKPVLVVIDPFAEFIQITNINDYTEVYEKLHPTRELARRSGAHVLFLHHTSKAQDWILGSQAIKGTMDSTFIYRKTEDGMRIIQCDKIRTGAPFEPIAISFDPLTQAVGYAGPASAAEEESLCKMVAEISRAEQRSLSRNEVKEATGFNSGLIWRALAHNPGDHLERLLQGNRVVYRAADMNGEGAYEEEL